MGGMSGVARPFCDYIFYGSANLCANSNSIIFLAWNFKVRARAPHQIHSTQLASHQADPLNTPPNPQPLQVLFALVTDTWKPFGLRRKPYILTGWLCILGLLLAIAASADRLTAESWIGLSMLVQFFVMVADVPGAFSPCFGRCDGVHICSYVCVGSLTLPAHPYTPKHKRSRRLLCRARAPGAPRPARPDPRHRAVYQVRPLVSIPCFGSTTGGQGPR